MKLMEFPENQQQMNTRNGSSNINSRKAPLPLHQYGKEMELEGNKSRTAEKTTTNRRRSARDRKLALLQDVDNLKKKLRHEENVHRALQRASNRPLGTLPRLPPYLPQHILELLAEVAVLEEEVVRLEEQIVNFRKGLYQEAAYISSRRSLENSTPHLNHELSIGSFKLGHSRSSSQSEVNLGSIQTRPCHSPSPSLSRVASIRKILFSEHEPERLRHCLNSPIVNKRNFEGSGNGLGRENKSSVNFGKDSKPNTIKKSLEIKNDCNKRLSKNELTFKSVNSPKMQCRIVEQAHETSSSSSDTRVVDADSEANKLSENILNCLIKIFVRLSSSKGKSVHMESFSSLAAKAFSGNDKESSFRDPYCNSSESKNRDIGTYKYAYIIEAGSIDLKRKAGTSFLIQRLKILLDKLSHVRLDGLSHQQKLAFWINIYNACIMNAFLDHGIPATPEKIVVQMQTAKINVGQHMLNALTIEHLILRLPYHLKYTCSKTVKNDERRICEMLGLEWSEPLVTFALSCGSWSSPSVRVYTAAQVETELEAAKRDYLQAAVFISPSEKIVITKLLDWYLLDFAKDFCSLIEWICLQLPDKVGEEAIKCFSGKVKGPLSNLVQVMPYNFSFRYLIHR